MKCIKCNNSIKTKSAFILNIKMIKNIVLFVTNAMMIKIEVD